MLLKMVVFRFVTTGRGFNYGINYGAKYDGDQLFTKMHFIAQSNTNIIANNLYSECNGCW